MSQNSSEKQRQWLLPSVKNSRPAGGSLTVVATPIGNLADITVRALDILSTADIILCEDTRVTKSLLKAYGIHDKALWVYNDHNTADQRASIVATLTDGAQMALVSDAGMPLISDPGYKLIQACRAADIHVTTLPGANAVLAALQLSGLPSDQFSFLGFLPAKKQARLSALQPWARRSETIIMYESAKRLIASLEDIAAALGTNCAVAVVREMTKLFEETRTGSAEALIAHYHENGAPKGEIVIVVRPDAPDDEAALRASAHEELRALIAHGMKTKQAAQYISTKIDLPKATLYDIALSIKASIKNEA